MSKFIKTTNYSYINTDFIVRIDYTPIEHRAKQYKNDPVDVKLVNGDWFKISIEDAKKLLEKSTPNDTK